MSLPEDIGRLIELRVLNLTNNYLKYLPYSIVNLPNLTALWLSENQKKPLMVLQTDRDERTDTKVLTCFLFPLMGPSSYTGNYRDDRRTQFQMDFDNQRQRISQEQLYGRMPDGTNKIPASFSQSTIGRSELVPLANASEQYVNSRQNPTTKNLLFDLRPKNVMYDEDEDNIRDCLQNNEFIRTTIRFDRSIEEDTVVTDDTELPTRLSRLPTPFPKELRNSMANNNNNNNNSNDDNNSIVTQQQKQQQQQLQDTNNNNNATIDQYPQIGRPMGVLLL